MFIYDKRYVSKKEGCYYSCPWIEHGIVFFNSKLTMCCHCSHEGGGHTMIRNNYIGQKIDWDRVFYVKDIFRRFHKKGKINSTCIGCVHLEEKNWSQERYIDNLYISHWLNCNSKCIYCYATQHREELKVDKYYDVLPIVKEMMEKGILRPGGMISFGGGEPTLLSEFEDLVTYFLDNFYWGIRVHTSGILFSPALARAINEIRAYVVVSVDSGSPETFMKVKQVPCYDKVRETIRKYALHTTFLGRYLVGAKYIIIPGINDNIEEIEKWLQANYEAGLYTTVMDLEETWYLEHKGKVPKYIYKLVEYARKRAKQLNCNFEIYERLQNLNADNEKKSLLKKLFN